MTWTKKHIDQLLKEGKIRSYKISPVKDKAPAIGGRKVAKYFPKKSKEKDFLSRSLLNWCEWNHHQLEEEYKFHAERRWRFDWAIPSLKIAVEYEGIFSEKSRHTSVKGFTGDTEKYNTAASLGWKVYRYTAINYQNLVNDIKLWNEK